MAVDLQPLTIGGVYMSGDESGRVRTPMSPATWTADEAAPASQTPEGEKEPEKETPKKPSTKKAA
jgi:hypothetical protein